MNKQDISNQTKVPVQAIDSILNSCGFPKDLTDYTDEHLTLVLAVKDIHKNEGVKSWVEAVGIFRKPEREGQLKEIALRHELADERIPETLAAMKLRLESITDEQIEQFHETCRLLQTGMSLEMASQTTLNNAKAEAKAKAKAKATPEQAQDAAAEQQPSVESSPASDKGAALAPRQDSPQPGLAMQAIPTGHGETLQSVVDIAVDTAGFDVNGRIATKALDAAQALDGAIDEAIWRSLTDPSRANALSAEKVVEAINREREQRHGR